MTRREKEAYNLVPRWEHDGLKVGMYRTTNRGIFTQIVKILPKIFPDFGDASPKNTN